MSNNSTANDLPVKNTTGVVPMTQKEFDTNVIRLMLEEPFYAGVLRGVNYVCTESIPTAGVMTQDYELTMLWNPNFLGSLTRDEVKGLLKHEAMHLALMHTTSRRMDPHIIHNYATDLAINSDIPSNELPEGGLVPGEKFLELTAEKIALMSPESVDRYNRISEAISELPKHMSSEWYFAKLLEDDELAKDIQQSSESGDFELMDSHDEWESLSDEEKEVMKAKIKQVVSDAVKECDRTGRWGNIGSETRSELRRMITNEVDWKAVLKRFCGNSRRGTRTTSWTKINRKYAGMVPGAKRGYTSSIAVYIDQSGSVSNSDLEIAFGELEHLAKKTEFTTFHFDTEVDEKSETLWKKSRVPSVHRTRCGGTDFNCVSKHANDNKHRFDGYLVITDGEASNPGPSRLKRGWLLVPNTRLIFDKPPRDFVMNMKEK